LSNDSFSVSNTSNDSDYDFNDDNNLSETPEELYKNTQQVKNTKWKEVSSDERERDWLPTFKTRYGVKNCKLAPESEPFEFFALIFSEQVFEDLTSWTNKKASTKIDNSQRRKQKKSLWSNLSYQEMKAFVGILLAMGIIKLPNYRMYWDKLTKLFSVPGINEIMTEQRFEDIYGCLVLRDPSSKIESRLYEKIEPFVTQIITNSQFHYQPSQNLSVDESMISFSGRSSIKVFMPLKPIKIGLKAYVLCESSTGFVLNWDLHTGEIKDDDYGVTYKIVMKLTESYEGEGYVVFMDRFYTSLQLFTDLKMFNIGAVGTIQQNRAQLSKEHQESIQSLQYDEIIYFRNSEELLLSVWKDRKSVLVVSNYHQPEEEETERRTRRKDYTETTVPGEKVLLSIPKSIIDYTAHMGGVDHFDQVSQYYSPQIRTHRWYIKIFLHFLEISVVNSYTIYKNIVEQKGKKPLSHLEFRKQVIRGLVKEARIQKNIQSTHEKKMIRTNSLPTNLPTTIGNSNKTILVDLSDVRKQLDFASTSSKQNTNSQKTVLREENITTNKRKSTNNIKIELEEEINKCFLQEIPRDLGVIKKDNRKICEF